MVHLLSLPLHFKYSTLLFLIVSYVFSIIIGLLFRNKYRFSILKSIFISTLVFFFGVVGTIILANIQDLKNAPLLGFSFYGALFIIPIFLFVYWVCTRKDRYIVLLNYSTFIVLTTLVVMRINCTLSGCCYGIESTFGIKYENIIRFPVQLMESTLVFIILVLFIFNEYFNFYKRCRYPLLMILYGFIRLICEVFRDDQTIKFFNMTDGQLCSIVSIIIGSIRIVCEYTLSKRSEKSSTLENIDK